MRCRRPVEEAHPRAPGLQGTVIVERGWKVPLAGEGRKPRLHRRHRVYKLVEDTKHRPKENLELILTQSVDGKARGEVLLSGWFCSASTFFCPFTTEKKRVKSTVIVTLISYIEN